MSALIQKHMFVIKLFFFALLCTGLAAAGAFAKNTCIDCHKDENFRVQNRALFDYYNIWKGSSHELAGVMCEDCHGGNSLKTNKDSAHKGTFLSLTSIEKSTFKVIPQRCGACHEAVLKNFVDSKHYTALLNEGTGPHCATCHGSMNSEVYYTPIVKRACAECHNEYTKNSPEVVGEADKILHRINVSRVFRNWINIHYSDRAPERTEEINGLYRDITNSWHTFDFTKLDEKSENLLNKSKSLVNKAMAEKRKK